MQRGLRLNHARYDALNRLAYAEETGAWNRTFGMDRYGNAWVEGASGVTPGSFTPRSAGWFDGQNRLVNAGLPIAYEASGNVKQMGGFGFTYDGEQKLATSTIGGATTQFGYDGEGRRVKKGGVVLVYDAFGRLAAEYGGVGAAAVGTQTRYWTTDQLGSVRAVTVNGAVAARRDYLPYGEEIGPPVGGRGALWGAELGGEQRFTGKERDGETGLDYFGARYFSGAIGRFTSPDPPLFDQDPADPQSWTLYSYVRNNPLRFTDPTGRACIVGKDGDYDDGGPGQPCSEAKKPQKFTYNERGDLFSEDRGVFYWHPPSGYRHPIGERSLEDRSSDLLGLLRPNLNFSSGLGPVVLNAAKNQGKRGFWQITRDGTDRVIKHSRFGKFYKSKNGNDWITEDNAGHGGSRFKRYQVRDGKMQWQADLDEFGDDIVGKHKGPVGRFIPLSEFTPSTF